MLCNHPLHRRRFLSGALTLLAAATSPWQAAAAALPEAEAQVERLINEVMAAVNSGEEEAVILRRFQAALTRYGDLPNIARSSLGVAWRRASDKQKAAYIKAYARYVSVKYGRLFNRFEGSKFTLQGSRDAGRKGLMVTTLVDQKGFSPYVIEWQLSDKSGSLRIFNIIMEGISMIGAERQEIGALLEARNGNLDALIRYLETF